MADPKDHTTEPNNVTPYKAFQEHQLTKLRKRVADSFRKNEFGEYEEEQEEKEEE